MKIALLGLVFCSFYYVGSSLSKNYYRRKYFFEDMLLFCSRVEAEVSFGKNSIVEIVKNSKNSFRKEFKSLISSYLTALDKNSYCNIKDLQEFVDKGLLEDEEHNFVLHFLSVLGKSDVNEQLKSIKSFEYKFKEFYKTSTQKIKEGNLIKKVSIMMGIAVCIIFA